jgi:Na+-transporting NADH:ubiquinone oxidoreductase subunit C
MPKETIGKTIAVAVGVCVVCSVFVSSAAVYLKPMQEANKALEKKRYILLAAGLMEEGERADVDELFKQIDPRWIEISTGKFVAEEDLPPESLDERKAAKDPKYSEEIQDPHVGIGRKANYRQVYFTGKGDEIERIILPVHGKGLWSTMYGFLALDRDMTTIRSFAFYEHGETPGLGGEVDNPRWKASWVGKRAFDDTWELKLTVVKGNAGPDAVYEVDGLSGATLTARGVQNLVRFWLGEEGYGPLLKKLREGKLREGADHG